MAAEKVDLRDVNFRQVFPWMELFRGFQVALDPKKLLLAAAGLLTMALGWWVLANIFFYSREKPDWKSGKYTDWAVFREDREKWNLLNEAAGPAPVLQDASDVAIADTSKKYDEITRQAEENKVPIVVDGQTVTFGIKPFGKLRTWPWFEDRGPNPYLLITGETVRAPADGFHSSPWERGHFWDWLLTKQVPVLIEPLIKFFRPVIYLLSPNAGFWNRVYFLLVLLWSLATWALFGGAITRMAAVQVARKEKIGMGEAVRFTLARYVSFFSAPLIPLVFVLVGVLFLIVFGFFHAIPIVGDIIVDGLGWPLVILAGLGMAVLLVGLVGWPMMYATISSEGSDSFDALSRSYSYVYQNPWQYIWYCLVALVYGIFVVFFVGFMGSLMVYLGKWGVSHNPLLGYVNREPEYLFLWAPTSFGWHDLLLHGSPHVTNEGTFTPEYQDSFRWYNYAGALLVAGWLYLIFLMIVGFAYSYFWSSSTIIYLLMRRKVDDTELDEVYLDDEEAEAAYQPASTPAAPGTSSTPGNLTMVEPPSFKTPAPAIPPQGDSLSKEQGDVDGPSEKAIT